MKRKRLALIVSGAILLIIGTVAFLPRYFENRIAENFDLAKMQEIKSRNNDQYNELVKNFNEARTHIKKDPSNHEAWLTIGLVADTFNDNVLAERAYKRSIELDPLGFMSRNNLAVIYKEKALYDLARDMYLSILKDRPTDTQMYYALAEMYAAGHAGTVDDAKRIIQEGVEKTGDEGLKQMLQKMSATGDAQ